MNQTLNFLTFLYEYLGPEYYLYLWTLPDRKTHSFTAGNLPAMALAAAQLAGAHDVYFGVGATAKALGQHERSRNEDVTAIPGLWIDIDVFSPGAHKIQALPPDITAAMGLLPNDLPPSLIVWSGYGLHVYWLFREPWTFDSPEERSRASELLRTLQAVIKNNAAGKGWKLDTTADLARILRVPGTMNRKIPDSPVMAQVIEQSDIRYNPTEIEDLLPAVEAPVAPSGRTDKFERRPTDGSADAMLRNCRFLQHCQINAGSITYDEWLAALTNIVRGSDGIQAAHQVSAMDPKRYKPEDTDKKVDEALAMNPQNCDYIRGVIGFAGCPQPGCGVKAPCGWSLSKVAQARAVVRAIPAPSADNVFTQEVINSVAILKKDEPLEYARFRAACKGRVNLNDLDKAINQIKTTNSKQDSELDWNAAIGGENEADQKTKTITIVVTNRFLHSVTREAVKALVANNEPPKLFNRNGEISKVAQIWDKDKQNQAFTQPIIKPVNEASLRGYLARSADFVKAREVNGETKYYPTSPSMETVRDILSLDDLPFPLLRGIVQAPAVRWDGTLTLKPGYDTATSLYYAPEPGFSLPDIPDTPTSADIKNSIQQLCEIIIDFPFDGPASFANFLAAILTPVLRDLIPGPVPMLLIDKPSQGTGASLLAGLNSIITTGRNSYVTTAPEGRQKEDEWRKRITSILSDGLPLVVIDNLEAVFNSPTLCALLTSENWSDRILGRNEIVNLQHRTCWLATGNNIRLAGDLPRRCYKVRLDANLARPWQRHSSEFKHPHLLKFVKQNRGALLAAIYTIARAWIIAGRPAAAAAPPMGSFEEWRDVIGGMLEFAGVNGFLGNVSEIYENAEINEGIEDLIEALYQELGEKAISTKQILNLISYESSKFLDVLPDWLDPGERGFTRKLGRVLARKAGVIFTNGYKLEKYGMTHRAQLWKIRAVE